MTIWPTRSRSVSRESVRCTHARWRLSSGRVSAGALLSLAVGELAPDEEDALEQLVTRTLVATSSPGMSDRIEGVEVGRRRAKRVTGARCAGTAAVNLRPPVATRNALAAHWPGALSTVFVEGCMVASNTASPHLVPAGYEPSRRHP